jgi:L-asparagine transporter-like permease
MEFHFSKKTYQMHKSTIVIIIYIIGLIFGALVLDIWSAETSPKALLGIGWTALLLVGLFFAEKDEKK